MAVPPWTNDERCDGDAREGKQQRSAPQNAGGYEKILGVEWSGCESQWGSCLVQLQQEAQRRHCGLEQLSG